MKLCNVSDLVGNEVIAKTVMTHDYQILLSEGTIIKKSYIRKLLEHDIESVYIRGNDIQSMEEVRILKKQTEHIFQERVKTILEQNVYGCNDELEEFKQITNVIISSILANERVMEQVYDIRGRSNDIYEHSVNVCAFSVICALHMHIDETRVHDIGLSALLHDMGIRYIPKECLNKKLSELSSEEKAEFKKHPVYAYSSLESAKWISENSKKMILYHHEHLDGSGYPLKISKFQPEHSIIAVCDTFDEMICGIGCDKVKIYEAIEYLKAVSGTYFHDKVVSVFLGFIAAFPIGCTVLLSDGSRGIVIKQNDGFPERPVLQVISDGKFYGTVIDLLKNKNLTVIGTS